MYAVHTDNVTRGCSTKVCVHLHTQIPIWYQIPICYTCKCGFTTNNPVRCMSPEEMRMMSPLSPSPKQECCYLAACSPSCKRQYAQARAAEDEAGGI